MSYTLHKLKHEQLANRIIPIGDDGSAAAAPPPKTTLSSVLSSSTVKTASGVALIYHGYKRTNSILWALAYGLVGRAWPVVAVPIALAQGFGTRKPCP